MKVQILLAVIATTSMLKSEVISSDENAFHLKITQEVSATPSDAYTQFLNVGEWWSSEHTWFGDAKNMTIEPKAGGCFCERANGNEVMHMQVSAVFVDKEIVMLGGLGPLQKMGITGVMTWRFEMLESGKTQITNEYRVIGHGQDDMPGFAEIVNKVQTLQLGLLAKKLNQAET